MFDFEYGLWLLCLESVDLTRKGSSKELVIVMEVQNYLVEEDVLFEDALRMMLSDMGDVGVEGV